MKQLLQDLKTGEAFPADVPASIKSSQPVLVRTVAYLVCAGVERMEVDFARKSLLGKARARPDLIQRETF